MRIKKKAERSDDNVDAAINKAKALGKLIGYKEEKKK